MQGKDFIFAIQSKDNKFWSIVNGQPVLSSQPYFLSYAPSGWEDIVIQNVRNKTYWGIDRSVSSQLSFVKDGAQIIKHIFYNLGIEQQAFLVIASQRLDYDIVEGAINLSTLISATANECIITGKANKTVYLKLTPSTINDVQIFIDPGDGSYHQFGELIGGNASVFPLTLSESGSFSFKLYFTGDQITTSMTLQDGTIIPQYGFWYKQTYRSELDLSAFQHDGSKVTCPCLEDGLPKYLKANENTEFEFPFDANAVNVMMDGIRLHDKAHYSILGGSDGNYVDISKSVYSSSWFAGVTYLTSDGDNFGISAISAILNETPSAWVDIMKSDNCLLQNLGNKEVTLNVTGHIEFTCVGMVSEPAYACKVRFLTSTMPIDPANQDRYKIIDTIAMTVGTVYSADINLSITLLPNEKLFLLGIFYGGPGTDVTIRFTGNNDIAISFITRRDTTYIKAFRPQYIFEQLVNKVTEGNFTSAKSVFLDQHKNILLTSGNAIREIPDATIKIKFSDFFKWWNCFTDVALFLNNEGNVDMDFKKNIIDTANQVLLPITAYQSLKVSVAKDYLFNELQIGYPEIKSDVGALNGNEEFNTKFIFSVGTTKSPSVLDKISPFKASCYEIEKIRTTKFYKDTTDYKSDNDVFLLHIEDTLQPAAGDIPEHYLLNRSLNAGATGLVEPASVFNIALSPKRMLLNNGDYLRSCFLQGDDKTLKFISADKNSKMIAAGVVENADINLGNLSDKFFMPVTISFDVSINTETEDALALNPKSLLVFEMNGDVYGGIINKVSVAPSNKMIQSFELLAHSSSDLSKLIEYNG